MVDQYLIRSKLEPLYVPGCLEISGALTGKIAAARISAAPPSTGLK